MGKKESKARLVIFRTPWGRRLANFKKDHPKLYSQIRFRWIDIGLDDTPQIDRTGIKVAYFPKAWYRTYFSDTKSKRMPVITSIAFEKKKFTLNEMKNILAKEYGLRRVKPYKTGYDAFPK